MFSVIAADAYAATVMNTGNSAKFYQNSITSGRIIFIPHDNRPVSDEMPVDTVCKAGVEVVVPPDKLLGSREFMGNPDELWKWLEENATVFRKPTKEERKRLKSDAMIRDLAPDVKGIVISADSMIYGSLVGSRKHSIPEATLKERVKRFADFKDKYPAAKMYVFASIMRTPSSGEHSGTEEPEYYQRYGIDIFRYTVLNDMADEGVLSTAEEKERSFLKELIPAEYINDWLNRRAKNLNINKELLRLSKNKVFECFALGRDDCAAWSQTHMESRHLTKYAQDLAVNNVHNLAGIDELGMLLLVRTLNDIRDKHPAVTAQYNWGNGCNTIPTYSDEPIDTTVREGVALLGGRYVETPEQAEFLLLVNTNPNGETLAANWYSNSRELRPGVRYFADMVEDALKKRYPVGIADVSFVNGADNSLMEELNRRQLLFKVKSYSGWNTPTNSVGYAIAQGILAKDMKDDDKNMLLAIRYLDDWAYQSNVRQTVARQLSWFEGAGVYSVLGDNKSSVEWRATTLLQLFAQLNMPNIGVIKNIRMTSPWNRLFEARIRFIS
ncbi:MAG: DUF4127 family protein [Anaerovibrio sp.]|uniref:DUF4127 family protein n=1 Tax=Anaerovibrio sp. TaxID=1872532 RepID=UPI0025FCBB12|nr:DUF4127 family protein [Anaerovibrio sp.]MCR5177199.1 DUF4127 family protein [Anaerovibrio sp.]